MRTLTKENARELLGGRSLDAAIVEFARQLPLVEGAYSAPTKSGVQIALAKLFVSLMLRETSVCLCVTGWGIAMEHMDLFNGYRRSLGEKRALIEAPVHIFDPADEDAFISLLCLVFFFSWDATVFEFSGRSMLQTSHDGWLEIRTSDEAIRKSVAVEMEGYRVALLAP